MAWCVQHSDGWCATATGKASRDSAVSVKTLCRHYVFLPWGSKRRKPTCPKCLAALEVMESKA